jgi:hypothetical protein
MIFRFEDVRVSQCKAVFPSEADIEREWRGNKYLCLLIILLLGSPLDVAHVQVLTFLFCCLLLLSVPVT